MRYIFRTIVLLLLLSVLVVVLLNNKKAVHFEADNAKTVIDSIPVRIFNLRPDSANFTIETVGKVKSADEVYVVSQTPGEIKRVLVKIGEKVSQGDTILQIDDFYTRQEYNMAKKAMDQIQKDYNRYANLSKVDAVTQQQLEQLRLQLEGAQTKLNSLEQRINDYTIKAPVGGVVNQLFVSRGNPAGTGTPVCEIIGGNLLKIQAKINAEQAGYLITGIKATIRSEFNHGESYMAQLSELGERAGKFGGVDAIFILLPEETKVLKTGILVNIQIEVPGIPRLLLPRQALTNYNGQMGLYVISKNNKVEFTAVKYLDFDDDHINVLENSLINKLIVIEGNYLLKTGDLVKVMN